MSAGPHVAGCSPASPRHCPLARGLRTTGNEWGPGGLGGFARPTCIGNHTLPGKRSMWGRAVGHGHFSVAAQSTFSLFYYCRKLHLEGNIRAHCPAGSALCGKQAGGMGAAGRSGQTRGKPHPRQNSARAGEKLSACRLPESSLQSWKQVLDPGNAAGREAVP